MRATFNRINTIVQRNIALNHDKLANTQTQLSTGKRLNKPSDNPTDVKNDMILRAELEIYDQYKRNIDDGKNQMSYAEVSLTDMNAVYQRVRELTIQASNDIMSPKERGYIADEVEQLMEQLVQLSNTKYKGDFIFGGTNGDKQIYTKTDIRDETNVLNRYVEIPAVILDNNNVMINSDRNRYQPPYQYERLIPETVTVTDDAGVPTVFTEGTDFTVDYKTGHVTALSTGTIPAGTNLRVSFEHFEKTNRANTNLINREIEQGVLSPISVPADDIFENSENGIDMPGVLLGLIDALNRSDGNEINNLLSDIDVLQQQTLSAQSTNGARINRYELTLERNENKQIEITRMQSELEDLDFAEAIMNFSLQENVFNASLSAGAKVIRPTLGDFIG